MNDERVLFGIDVLPGLTFFDQVSGRDMRYVYPDTPHWAAGWLLYRHPEGQWVTLRRATEEDVARLSSAVVTAHHDRHDEEDMAAARAAEEEES